MVKIFGHQFAAIALACALVMPASAQSGEPDPAKVADYKTLQRLDQRLADVGFRLQKSATPWCSQTEYALGWVVTDRLQYPAGDQSAVARSYGTSWPGASDFVIAAVAKNSPAARNKFHVGEAVLAIDDYDLATATADEPDTKKSKRARKKGKSFDRMAAVEAAMIERFADGTANIRIKSPVKAGQGLSVAATIPIELERVCASLISLHVGSSLSAGADGRRVRINHKLAVYAADDAELAWIVAHELSHNILGHPQRLNKAKINRGLFQEFGKSAKLTRQTEDEADRLSIWLMVKAGYDPHAGIRFWERYGPEHDSPLIRSATHSRWKDRIETLRSEIGIATSAFATDANARPPMLTANSVTDK